MRASDFVLLCLACLLLLLVVIAVSVAQSPTHIPIKNGGNVVLPTNLAPVPNGWDHNYTGWRGLNDPYNPDCFHYPVAWQGKTCIQLDWNPEVVSHGWPSISECDSYKLPIKPGDRIIFKAAIWAGNSTIGDNNNYNHLSGCRACMDMYGAKGRIVEVNIPDGRTSYPDWGGTHALRAQTWTPWGTSQWKYVVFDFIVQDSYIADPDGAYTPNTYVQATHFVPIVVSISFSPLTERGKIYFADTEIYINPSPPPIQYYYVTTRAEAGGTVAPSITSCPIVVGRSFTAVATAHPDYDFSHWTNNTVTITPIGIPTYTFEGANDCAYEVVAHFAYNPEPDPSPDPPVDPAYFTVNIGTTKGITTDLVGVQTVLAGQTLTVNVTHVAGNYRFAYWRLDGNVWGSSRTFGPFAGTANTSYTLQPVAQYVPPPPPIVFIPPGGLNVGIVGRSKMYKQITAKAKKQKPIDLSKIFKRLKKAKL